MICKCPLCDNLGKIIFEGEILRKYKVKYYQCNSCGLIYTEKAYWLEEAYSDAIADTDTGIMQRNIKNVLITNIIIKKYFDMDGRFLDYGGGGGFFVRMMRDIGFNFLWMDKYCLNLVARGFEYTTGKIELLCAWELLEHFENPKNEIEHLFSISDSILFSTLLYSDNLTYKNLDKWWYYSPHSGQHICFYSKTTLKYIAQKYHVNYYKISDEIHLFTKKKCSESILYYITHTRIGKIYELLEYAKRQKKSLIAIDARNLEEGKIN